MKTVVFVGSLPDSLVLFRGDLIRTLVEKGHRVYGCASVDDKLAGMKVKDPSAALKEMGATFVDIPVNRTSIDPKGDLELLKALRGLFREIKPDIVVTYTQKPLIYGTMAAGDAGVPLVVPMVTGLGFGLRDYEIKTWKGRIVRLMYKFAFIKANTVIFQNNDDLQHLRDLGIVKAKHKTPIVNGSGVDTRHYAPAPFPTGPTTFLLIGRLLKTKGVMEYVEAARMLKQRGVSARILLAGPVEDQGSAIGKAELDGFAAEGILEYLGSLDDVRPAIASSHVYVLPSYHEGTPRTVLEAMAMGRPIVTTDAPGCRETVVDGQNGFIVPVRDARALADAMERFIKNPELIPTMGEAARKVAVDKYSVDLVNRQIIQAIDL